MASQATGQSHSEFIRALEVVHRTCGEVYVRAKGAEASLELACDHYATSLDFLRQRQAAIAEAAEAYRQVQEDIVAEAARLREVAASKKTREVLQAARRARELAEEIRGGRSSSASQVRRGGEEHARSRDDEMGGNAADESTRERLRARLGNCKPLPPPLRLPSSIRQAKERCEKAHDAFRLAKVQSAGAADTFVRRLHARKGETRTEISSREARWAEMAAAYAAASAARSSALKIQWQMLDRERTTEGGAEAVNQAIIIANVSRLFRSSRQLAGSHREDAPSHAAPTGDQRFVGSGNGTVEWRNNFLRIYGSMLSSQNFGEVRQQRETSHRTKECILSPDAWASTRGWDILAKALDKPVRPDDLWPAPAVSSISYDKKEDMLTLIALRHALNDVVSQLEIEAVAIPQILQASQSIEPRTATNVAALCRLLSLLNMRQDKSLSIAEEVESTF